MNPGTDDPKLTRSESTPSPNSMPTLTQGEVMSRDQANAIILKRLRTPGLPMVVEPDPSEPPVEE